MELRGRQERLRSEAFAEDVKVTGAGYLRSLGLTQSEDLHV